MESINIDKEDIYDILCGCGLYDMFRIENGEKLVDTVLEENNIMDDFIPAVMDYINEKLADNNIELFLI